VRHRLASRPGCESPDAVDDELAVRFAVRIGIYTVRDGQIIEAWFAEDILGMMLQLGIISLPT
jgi:hypothetical protein